MGDIERRRRQRNRADFDNPVSIEIQRSHGPVEKSVYDVLEWDEHGLSFMMPEGDDHFRTGAHLEYSLMNSGLSKAGNFGLVKYYQLFHNNTGEAFYKVGLENRPDRGPEPASRDSQSEREKNKSVSESPDIHFCIGSQEYSLPLVNIGTYSAAFTCTEEMSLDFKLSRVLDPATISVDGKIIYEGTAIIARRRFDRGQYRIVIEPRKGTFDTNAACA